MVAPLEFATDMSIDSNYTCIVQPWSWGLEPDPQQSSNFFMNKLGVVDWDGSSTPQTPDNSNTGATEPLALNQRFVAILADFHKVSRLKV